MPRITPRKPSPELAQALNNQLRAKPQTFRERVLDIQLEVTRIHARTNELRIATQRLTK